MSRKKPPLPPGWDAANTPILKFISEVLIIDINGKPYEMTVTYKHVVIVDQFSKEVIYDGSDELPGPYAMEGACYMLDKLQKYKEDKK